MSDAHSTYELVGPLPPGSKSRTLLVLQRGAQGFIRHVVFRELEEAQVSPPVETLGGVVPLLDVVRLGGQWYGVYEFSAGVTLGELLRSWVGADKPIPLTLVGRIIFDVARILHLAHTHRDALGREAIEVHGGVGEGSIQIGFDGQTRLLDFGARRNSRFLAPEAVRGGDIDARADTFSLAATAHWALAHYAGGYAAIMSRNPSSAEFPLPSQTHPECTTALDAAIRKGLYPDPESRPATTRDWATAFERALGGPLWTVDQVAEQVSRRFADRHRDLVKVVHPRIESVTTGEHRAKVPIGLSATAETAPPPDSDLGAETRPPKRSYGENIVAISLDGFGKRFDGPSTAEQEALNAPTNLLSMEPRTVGARPAHADEPADSHLGDDDIQQEPRRSVFKWVAITVSALLAAVFGGLAWLAKDDPALKERIVATLIGKEGGTRVAEPRRVVPGPPLGAADGGPEGAADAGPVAGATVEAQTRPDAGADVLDGGGVPDQEPADSERTPKPKKKKRRKG